MRGDIREYEDAAQDMTSVEGPRLGGVYKTEVSQILSSIVRKNAVGISTFMPLIARFLLFAQTSFSSEMYFFQEKFQCGVRHSDGSRSDLFHGLNVRTSVMK